MRPEVYRMDRSKHCPLTLDHVSTLDASDAQYHQRQGNPVFVEVEKTRARGREVKCVCSSTTPTHFYFPPMPFLLPLPPRVSSVLMHSCPRQSTKSFKSMVGGFKSYFVSDTHPLIAQPRPPTATHASTGVPRLPGLPVTACVMGGVRSAANLECQRHGACEQDG